MLGKSQKQLGKTTSPALPLNRCIAKSVVCSDGNKVQGISVIDHCRITGYVAEELLNVMIPFQRSLLPKSAAFCAAIHDVGKVSPDFQKMIYSSIDECECLTELKSADSHRAKRKEISFHGKVSQASIKNYVKDKEMLAILEGMHHGFKPNASPILETADVYGGEQWSKERFDLLKILQNEFSFDASDVPEDWRKTSVLGGFITVADWIASGSMFGTLGKNHSKTEKELRNMAKEAVHNAGFETLSVKKGLSFNDIFGFSPRKIQSDLFESVEGPGVYILEAPMGLGKTEAALYAAYKMLEKGRASGIYFGLPTQLTSNKIWGRVEIFLSNIIENYSKRSLKLLHGSAWMEEDSMGEDANSSGSWFDAKKRGILAPFAVGTIDQALMAAMNVKHSMVRSFGLAGKVVILDEVHSYDAYTGTIMNELVDQLRNIGCTVVILSATLTGNQKKNILKLPKSINLNEKYPLITTFDSNIHEITCDAMHGNVVGCSIDDDELKILGNVIEKASFGQQVLWIENTVAEAQRVYKTIAARASALGIECGLIHSRFIKKDRYENESKWVSLYGKDGKEKRTKCGRILVGTQVLEQSIDIDADFLVSRICPMDMLLQRIGRLWRHRDNDSVRPKSAKCEVVVLAPDYAQTLKSPKVFKSTGVVYSPYILCRTLEVLETLERISIPEDIRPLLEKVYENRTETGALSDAKSDLEKIQKSLQGMAKVGLSTAIQTLPESTVQTRYSELQTYNILLLSNIELGDGGFYITFWGESEKYFYPKKCLNIKRKRELSKQIMLHSVNVSGSSNLSNIPLVDSNLQIFCDYVYLGSAAYNADDDEQCLFRVVKVGNDGFFRNLQNVRIELNDKDEIKKLIYTKKLGYQVE